MTQIAAAQSHHIEITPAEWRLSNDTNLLASASSAGLYYTTNFASTRRLPKEGELGREAFMQIVAGWQQRDECWHLGLIVIPALAEKRGSRWCELAAWPDPEQDIYIDMVREAGRGLSSILGLPFHVIPPKEPEPLPVPPLPDLPISSGYWTLETVKVGTNAIKGTPVNAGQLALVRSSKWAQQKVMRALWYTFWLIVYVILSVATLLSDIALPNAGTLLPSPEMLPYLGLATAGLLGVMVLWNLIQAWTAVKVIVIDPEAQSMSAYMGKTPRWHKKVPDIQSVYVSEQVKKRSNDPLVEHGELNLHLGSGDFHFVLEQGAPESNEDAPTSENKPRRDEDTIMPLSREAIHTHLQAMALHIAEALRVPCWYDMRVK
ncbi:hypothetical protein G4Y79_08235 [Phototrophicus methaneseepsis]|uniref:Uncharacterized protein n=1 Tax=Phototrophicus methaneseepsis TaxID=2710758 RepID=A0A7S8ECJ0_9CHLR|nr:hypothetical protein [Phototrophicus methaneseepsis]QPC84349.1 hypothetical protein G4Y79_08235 [Phototrophicus methaneseepsis]